MYVFNADAVECRAGSEATGKSHLIPWCVRPQQ